MRNWFSPRPFHQSPDRIKNLGEDAQSRPLVDALKAFDQKAMRTEGGGGGRGGGGGAGGPAAGRPVPIFAGLIGSFDALVTTVDGADSAPTEAMRTAFTDYCKDFTTVGKQWDDLRTTDIPALNVQLTGKNQSPLKVPPALALPVSAELKRVVPAAVKDTPKK